MRLIEGLRRFLLLGLCCAGVAVAQSESALKAFFEGKQVRVKIDMPATSQGIDVTPGNTPAVDFKDYSRQIKSHGTSIHKGESIMVTLVRVKARNIEFQLGGGGYGTAGDESASVSLPSVSKTSRESELERLLKTEQDPRRRDEMSREKARLEDSRRREENYRRAEEIRLREIKRAAIAEKALRAGSRFNIWYPNNYLREAVPTPAQLLASLAEYVEMDSAAAPAALPPQVTISASVVTPPASTAIVTVLRRGLSREQVHGLIGRPAEFKEGREGQLATLSERFQTAGETVEVDYVEGVVVRYRITSR